MSCSKWTGSCIRQPCQSPDSIAEAQNKNLNQFCASASAKVAAVEPCTLQKSVDTGCKPCGQSNNRASYACGPCVQPKKADSYSCRPCGRSSKPESGECGQTKASIASNISTCPSTKSSSENATCSRKVVPSCNTVGGSQNVETKACGGKVVASYSCNTGKCSRAATQPAVSSKNVCVVAPEINVSACQQTRPRTSCCGRSAAVNIPCRSVPLQEPVARSSCNLSGKTSSSVDTLAIGTYVHIVAIQDKFRPAGQTSIQKIAAVVMYASSDGMYQLGTRKGIIGKLFTRDELDVKDYKKLTVKEVPNTKINMYEASTIAF